MARAWDKEKILSPRQESKPWPPEHRAGALSTELRELMESKVISLSSYLTGVLYAARINTIEVVMSSDKLIKKLYLFGLIGNNSSCRPIRSVIILVINKSDSRPIFLSLL